MVTPRTDEELAEEVLARVKAGESVAGALLAVVEEDEARVAAAAKAVGVARSGHTEIHYCPECGHLECVCDGHDPDDPHSYWKADG